MFPGIGFWDKRMIFGLGDGEIWRVAVLEASKGVVVGFADGWVGIILFLMYSC